MSTNISKKEAALIFAGIAAYIARPALEGGLEERTESLLPASSAWVLFGRKDLMG
ncbi:MAG: hypothetical protein SVM80_08340 [Halobacteriota archaeon]|nr:hypothetical protein [Halobacteriota archaeon]